MNLILSRKCWFIFTKCLNLPETDNSVVTIYLFSFSGRNWSMRTVTIPFKELSLYGFKNSCLKSLLFLSTPLFVLTEISSSPCRNARTQTSQLYKLTFAKISNIHNTIKSHQYRETIKWKPLIKRVCYLHINRDTRFINRDTRIVSNGDGLGTILSFYSKPQKYFQFYLVFPNLIYICYFQFVKKIIYLKQPGFKELEPATISFTAFLL